MTATKNAQTAALEALIDAHAIELKLPTVRQRPVSPASKVDPVPPAAEKPAETPEQTAERQRLINELLGHGDPPSRRRRWRR